MNGSATSRTTYTRSIARAGLPGIREAAPERAGDGVLEVGIGEHEHRILAAELEHAALESSGALPRHLAPGLHRAGEEHLRHVGTRQRRARSGPVNDADEAVGDARALEHVRDPLSDERRQRRGLEDDAVAGHQRERHLAERDRPRVVPRGDHGDHAERLVGERRATWSRSTAGASGSVRPPAASAPPARSSAARRSTGGPPSRTPRSGASPAPGRSGRGSRRPRRSPPARRARGTGRDRSASAAPRTAGPCATSSTTAATSSGGVMRTAPSRSPVAGLADDSSRVALAASIPSSLACTPQAASIPRPDRIRARRSRNCASASSG